ncbi:MAG TPA: cytochrome c, partial [Flavisolibacter sp.]
PAVDTFAYSSEQKQTTKTVNMKRNILILSGIVVMMASFTVVQQNDPWPVPDKYVKMANPLKADAEATAAGKAIWAKHCQSCHGKMGKGDGSKASQLKTLPGDFSKADFQKQTDGALYYKTVEGRDDMPSFKKKIPDQDELWSVVNYMRTMKK